MASFLTSALTRAAGNGIKNVVSGATEGASQSLAGAMAQMAKFGVKTAPDKTIDLPDGTHIERWDSEIRYTTPAGVKGLYILPVWICSSALAGPAVLEADKTGKVMFMSPIKSIRGKAQWEQKYMSLTQRMLIISDQPNASERTAVMLQPQGDARRADAFSESETMNQMWRKVHPVMQGVDGILDREYMLALHQGNPSDEFLAQEKKLGSFENYRFESERTVYVAFENEAEMKEWMTAIRNNQYAYHCRPVLREKAIAELDAMLFDCGSDVKDVDLGKTLDDLYANADYSVYVYPPQPADTLSSMEVPKPPKVLSPTDDTITIFGNWKTDADLMKEYLGKLKHPFAWNVGQASPWADLPIDSYVLFQMKMENKRPQPPQEEGAPAKTSSTIPGFSLYQKMTLKSKTADNYEIKPAICTKGGTALFTAQSQIGPMSRSQPPNASPPDTVTLKVNGDAITCTHFTVNDQAAEGCSSQTEVWLHDESQIVMRYVTVVKFKDGNEMTMMAEAVQLYVPIVLQSDDGLGKKKDEKSPTTFRGTGPTCVSGKDTGKFEYKRKSQMGVKPGEAVEFMKKLEDAENSNANPSDNTAAQAAVKSNKTDDIVYCVKYWQDTKFKKQPPPEDKGKKKPVDSAGAGGDGPRTHSFGYIYLSPASPMGMVSQQFFFAVPPNADAQQDAFTYMGMKLRKVETEPKK